MTSLAGKAAHFKDLHRPGDPVVLPTVWDAWSADLVWAAGFAGVTVGSHPLAAAVGSVDKEGMQLGQVLARVREITAAVDIPVSVDLESGYSADPGKLVDGVLEAGAVGFNIEDTVHAEGGRLREPQEHADFIAELRSAIDASGVPLVLNARTDLFLRQDGDQVDRVDRALGRLQLAAAAGADVLYPIGRLDEAEVRRLTGELPLPVNIVAMPDRGDRAHFAELGSARVSFGPFLQNHLATAAREVLLRW